MPALTLYADKEIILSRTDGFGGNITTVASQLTSKRIRNDLIQCPVLAFKLYKLRRNRRGWITAVPYFPTA